MEPLANLDEIDLAICDLLKKRKEFLSEWQKQNYDFSLVNDYLRLELLAKEHAKPYFSELELSSLLKQVSTLTFVSQMKKKVAYLGPDGTFTSLAMKSIFNNDADFFSQKTIPAVFKSVETDFVDFGVVPVENSTEGIVTYTADEFLTRNLKIIFEKKIRISFCLLSKCKEFSKIKKVYSHPQALAQCKNWLITNLPNAELVAVNSNGEAAEMAAKEFGVAALAAEIVADLYDLNVLAKQVEDLKQNYTRFLVISKKENDMPNCSKSSIICGIKDKPGALFQLLKIFSDHQINLSKIESRPSKQQLWSYNFYIDFEGNLKDKNVKKALSVLDEYTLFIKELGSYAEV